MSDFLVEQTVPGATTCVVIGRPAGPLQLGHFRHVLWCVADNQDAAVLGRINGALEVVPVAGDASEISGRLERFLMLDARRMPSVFVCRDVAHGNGALYTRVMTDVHAVLESAHRARFTRQQDGFSWQKHVLMNARDYAHRRMPSSWKNALEGVPAFVCGAGPSLDVSGDVLARHAGHAVVFAADSSLRALAKRGVTADFAVSVDVAKHPEKCLAPEQLPDRVVLSPVSPPTWQAGLPETSRFYLSNAQLTIDWLASRGLPRTEIAVTENCGATALELARYLGCAPIYLFGLDMAADPKNPHQRHHAGVDASTYANSGYKADRKNPTVPGNYAAELPSFVFGDWLALDARLASWPAGLVCNVNDRGARFRNTTVVHPGAFAFTARADKQVVLAELTNAAAEQSAERALVELRTIGRHVFAATQTLRDTLQYNGPAGLIEALRKLFANPDVGRVMGAYSLKLMPHLMPPVEGDAAFWNAQIDELCTLAELAARPTVISRTESNPAAPAADQAS